MITARILVASVLLGAVSWVVWYALDALLGRSLPAQIVSVGAAGAAGLLVYVRAVFVMRVPEAHQVSRLIRTQLGGIEVQEPGEPDGSPGQPGHRSPLTTYVPGLCVLPGRRDTPGHLTGCRPEGRRALRG